MIHQEKAVAAIVFLALLLTACAGLPGGNSDERISRLLVAPDKFVLYTCPEIAEKANETATRLRQLEGLMAQADAGPGGQLISDMAYRPEYLERRGDMNELRRTAASKNCQFVPKVDRSGG